MPTIAILELLRQQRRTKWQRQPARWMGLVVSTLLSVLLALTAIVCAWVYTDIAQGLPALESLPVLLDPPNGLLLQPTRLYDRTGQYLLLALENPAAAGKRYLPLDESYPTHLPASLITATLATMDATFWSNPGYSLDGLQDGSHPTIAQRIAFDLLLWDEPPGLRRNVRERILAAQITERFGRARILEWYLNGAKYGQWLYGSDAAALAYFGKSATQLTLAEAALLAAVADAPDLNPFDTPTLALERQKQVILKMYALGLITAEEAYQAGNEPIQFQPPVDNIEIAPAFTHLVIEQLASRFPLDRLERGGLRIITSLDYGLQLQASCVVDALVIGQGNTTEITALDGSACQAARLLPTLPKDKDFFNQLKANILVLDPQTGQILSLVGEITPGMDPAYAQEHPAGTLLTPFLYLNAFARGFSPASLLWDIDPQSLDLYTQLPNLDGKFHGPVRLRTALSNDYLIPAEQVLRQIGLNDFQRTAQQFGMLSVSNVPSGQVQTSEFRTMLQNPVTLLEAVRAFGILANQGILAGQWAGIENPSSESLLLDPVTVLRLDDLDGQSWWDETISQKRPVVSPELAYLITHILSDETARWPTLGHPNPLEIGHPVSAKTGRTLEGNTAWTLGYTPQLVVGAWVEQSNPAVPESAAQFAPLLWRAVIQYATREQPAQGWVIPPGIKTVRVCDPSGMLPTIYCPTIVNEVFLTGSEPVQYDTLYRAFQVNRETGRLATVFTPPEQIDEQIYLVVPPDAKVWAQQAGLPTPPDEYDVIMVSPVSADAPVRLSSPALFSYVKGQVSFMGNANGDDFSFYRLQVGEGLNPRQWLQITEDIQTPVEAGLLGLWNTEGLSGLYAIQLLVVYKDQHVETAITQVTVDNHSPDLTILSPTPQQSFSREASAIILQAAVSDDLQLGSVIFLLDGKPVANFTQAPFLIALEADPGKHTFTAQATDLAGNLVQAEVNFEVTR